MKRLFVLTLAVTAILATAQEKRFVIKGEMSSDKLCYSDETVKEVRLEQSVDGQKVLIASSKVENNKFVLEGIAPEMLGLYEITGFDNGCIQIFLEEGEINIGPIDAAYPVAAKIGGTPGNDMYQAYIDLNNKCIRESKERMKIATENIPADIKGDQEAELKFTSPTFYVNNLHFKVAVIDFVYKNLDSPIVLYIIKYAIIPTFTTDIVQEFLDAVPEDLHKYAMYKELVNEVRSAKLKVGSAAPDISGFTPDGKELTLSDFRGKYVFIDFWASWCGPCRREIPNIKAMYEKYNGKGMNFLGVAVWDAPADTHRAMTQLDIPWPVIVGNQKLTEPTKIYGIMGIPHIIIFDPEGRIISRGLQGKKLADAIEACMAK